MKEETNIFKFKNFDIVQDKSTMKVNTDAILLGSWAKVLESKHILDIGSGTGVIGLMTAQRATEAKIIGIEIEVDAFEESRYNFANSPFADRMTMIHGSVQDFWFEHKKSNAQLFDHIVSNPPFFTGGTFSSNENKANVRHAIKMPHGDLLNAVTNLLSESGLFSLILPYIEGYRFIELAKRSGLYASKITEVKPRENKAVERLLIEFNRLPETQCEVDEIIIYKNKSSDYTEDFISLTRAFYLNF